MKLKLTILAVAATLALPALAQPAGTPESAGGSKQPAKSGAQGGKEPGSGDQTIPPGSGPNRAGGASGMSGSGSSSGSMGSTTGSSGSMAAPAGTTGATGSTAATGAPKQPAKSGAQGGKEPGSGDQTIPPGSGPNRGGANQ